MIPSHTVTFRHALGSGETGKRSDVSAARVQETVQGGVMAAGRGYVCPGFLFVALFGLAVLLRFLV